MRRRLQSSRSASQMSLAPSGRVTPSLYRDLLMEINTWTMIRTLGALGSSRLCTRDRKGCYTDNVLNVALAVEVVT